MYTAEKKGNNGQREFDLGPKVVKKNGRKIANKLLSYVYG